jgi:manganese/zinc/iron transport system substrate-binding protein
MRIVKLGLIFTVVMFIISCGQQDQKGDANPSTSGQNRINIVATIGMITDITQIVGGEYVRVTGLMGPGVDPHLYKASAGDVDRLSKADIIFYNGLHLEAKMGEVLERMSGRIKTVAVTDYIDKSVLLTPPEFAGAHDPHVWFDVTLWMKAVERVRDTLIAFDADHADSYRANTTKYLEELAQFHDYVKMQAEKVTPTKRVVVTAHDAFNYFGRAYGFEVRGLQGISTATEAGTADVQELAQFITQRRIPAMFVETSVSSRNIEAVQAAVKSKGFNVKIGGQLFSDAMGDPGTPEGSYIGMVRHNINTIVNSLTQTD